LLSLPATVPGNAPPPALDRQGTDEAKPPGARFEEMLKIEGGREERVHLSDGGEEAAGTRRVRTMPADAPGVARGRRW